MTRPATAPVAPRRPAVPDWAVFEPLQLTPVLTAALEAFHEHGYHGTSVRDIARRLGQSVPALYYHHESKEGVFVALLDIAVRDVGWRVEAAASGRVDVDARFDDVVTAIALCTTHRAWLAALDPESRHLPAARRRAYTARRKRIENLLTGIVREGAQRGRFSVADADETARAVLGMLQSIARWYRPRGRLSPDDVAARYVAIARATVGAA